MNNTAVIIVLLIAISIPCSFARNKRDVRSASTSSSTETSVPGRRSASTSTSGSSSTETMSYLHVNVAGRRSASTSTSSASSSSSSETEGVDNPSPQGPIEVLAQECAGDACVPLDGVAYKGEELLVDPPVIDVGEPAQ